jgi:hypothetical protein
MGHSQESEALLLRECSVFCRYYIGRAATDFVAQKYVQAHGCDARYQPHSAFDSALVGLARRGPQVAQLCDSYACLLARATLLRKKLVLLAALLESSAPEHGFDEQIPETPAAAVLVRMAWRGLLFVLRAVLALAVIVPIHFACAIAGGAKERP